MKLLKIILNIEKAICFLFLIYIIGQFIRALFINY